ncbi:MAG TPA: PleD family two-component system response regulator [Beijerinckiaceae bacterium]|nr:PleD family two-component system response regulator [Beijerinckiaceae bacterium]
MTARVLVVDDVLPNIKLLEARLTAEYFDVLTATSGPEALAICAQQHCDIVLLDVMMPGMDGFEVCGRLKADAATAHIPVVMVTALDQPADRVHGLEAGADDFLTKPVDEIALIARVRSLSRLKVVLDELRTRAATSASLGMPDPLAMISSEKGLSGRVLLVDDRDSSIERVAAALSKAHKLDIEKDPQEALFRGAEGDYDLFIVSLGLKNFDGLRLCSQIRSLERTRHLPVLMVADLEDRTRILRGLDLGVNDYLVRPIDRNEMIARVRTQLRRKRYADALRDNVQASIQAALVDSLTGLHNRRYLETHLTALLEQSVSRARPLSLMILDIDHFKAVNDTYGHDAGDEVLKVFAQRMRNVVRQVDLVCRLGGEEFVIVMPDTPIDVASHVAERVRSTIELGPFPIAAGERAIPVTVSVGLANSHGDPNPDHLFKRADRALYRSKNEGRNRVSADAA